MSAITSGERILSYAETEAGGRWDPSGIELAATPGGGGYVLEGTKLFVPYAHVANDFLVVARTGGSGEEGLTLFFVDAKTPGITCNRLETIGGERLYEVRFQGVAVPENRILGQKNSGGTIVRAIHEWGTAAKCAEMVGGAQRVLEMSVAYAKDRVQFGQPIGAFQAVQHYCANMAVDVDSSRFIRSGGSVRPSTPPRRPLSRRPGSARPISESAPWAPDSRCHRGRGAPLGRGRLSRAPGPAT